MSPNEVTPSGAYIAAPLVQHLLDLIRWHGLPADQILMRLGLTREDLNPVGGRLPAETVQRVISIALDVSGDPQLFLRLSKGTFTSGGFGVVGHLLHAYPTLKDCIDSQTRFEPLISNIGLSSLQHRPGQVMWSLDINYPGPLLVRQAIEFITGVRYRILLLAQEKRSAIALAVHFRHPPPEGNAGLQAYADVFQCPIYFNKPENALVLAASALNSPMRQPDPGLKDALEQQAEMKLGELDAGDSLREQVRRALRSLLQGGHASREILAEKLGVSSRHLGRQLGSAGTGYRELLDELRMEIAREQLLKSARSIDDIGARLGFSDGQSFIRWFRQMTGKSPGEFRQHPPA